MRSVLLSAAVLTTTLALAAGDQAHPAVLFAGSGPYRLGYPMAQRLDAAGFAIDQQRPPGMEGAPLTWDDLRGFNVVVVCGLGKANADSSLTEKIEGNLALLRRYLEAGGGVLMVLHRGQQTAELASQEAFLAPYGLQPWYDRLLQDRESSVRATAWQIPFAPTEAIAPSPLTDGVARLWYPLDTDTGAQSHSLGFTADHNWSVVVRTSRTASTRPWPIPGRAEPGAAPPTNDEGVPLVASRQVGKGRLVVVGITPEYLTAAPAETTLESIVLTAGLRGTASDGAKLVTNALTWLAAPSLAAGEPGGAKTNPALLEDPHKTRFASAFDWSRNPSHPAPAAPVDGLIGARTAFSTGLGSVADWVAAAKAAGLGYLVFLEDFAELSADEFAALQRDCLAATDAQFAALPGFTIDDEVGNHYFYFGGSFPYPQADYLTADGKRFRSRDTSLVSGDDHPPGQLAMTTLDYAYSTSGFKLTAGNYLFSQDAAPFADFFSNWDAVGVVTCRDNVLVENALDDYLRLVDSGQGPLPLAIDLMSDPARLATSPWRTVLRVPNDGSSSVGDRLEGRNKLAAYWSEWHFYPDNPSRIAITAGPSIDTWSYVGPRDYEGANRGDFVWQNHRWQLHGEVSSPAGLREVAVYDGTTMFRRFLPGAAKTYTIDLDLAHDQQHNLVLIATDANGAVAISGEQWDRNHRLEEFHCSDRNNQLSYGYLTRSDGYGLQLGGNQSLATPFKRIDPKEISPAGVFKNDGLLGAPAFDGAPYPEPAVFAPVIARIPGGEVLSPNVSESFRLFATGDLNVGEGRWANNFADGIRAANVWHTLWRTEPARDFTVRKRNFFFNVDPDSPLAVFLWQIEIRLLRDLPNQGFLLGQIRTGEASLWAARDETGRVDAGTWEAEPRSARRTLSVPLGVGGYLAALDSPLGGAVVYSLTPGLVGHVALPQREHTNCRVVIPADQAPQRAGDSYQASLLLVGIPRTTPLTAHLPAGTTEVAERFRSDFGLGLDGPGYRLDVKAGRVISAAYPLRVDSTDSGGFSGTIGGDLVSTLPVAVGGLHNNWSAVLYDRSLKAARPVGVFEGTGWAVVKVKGDLDLFLGHPLLADRDDVALQVTQSGEDAWSVEVHNPGDQAVQVRLRTNPAFEPLQGKAVPAEALTVPAGASVRLVV